MRYYDSILRSPDQEGAGGEHDLTQEELDAVQQIRNSGLSPREVVRRAAASVADRNNSGGGQRMTAEQVLNEAQRRGELAAQNVLRQAEYKKAVADAIEDPAFKDLSLDETDRLQIQNTVATAVTSRADFKNLTYEQTVAAVKEAAKAECTRRAAKGTTPGQQRDTAAARLAKQDDAVDSSRSSGRSAPPDPEDDKDFDDFDGSVCGTGDEKAFAMTDAELTAQYNKRANSFLKKARKAAKV